MTGTLRCYSFHSVKGGVGKSTLSVVTAVALAHEHPEARVVLIDMDLTGTSLADVLPLEAPEWEGIARDEPIDLLSQPSGFHDHDTSRTLIEEREGAEGTAAVGAPFLNDYLLFQTPDWDEETDVSPAVIAWRLRDGPNNLWVFPSSALPRDLERTLPVIYDEEHAAYLEGRLEYLLDALVSENREVFVVFDTPPTIPGLSRSVLSLALRLSCEPKTTLADDEDMPPELQDAAIDWRAYIVATLDFQDIRAAERWLPPQRSPVIRLALNRVGAKEEREQLLSIALRRPRSQSGGPTLESPDPAEHRHPYLDKPIWIEEEVALQEIFRNDRAPPVLRALLRRLNEEDEA